MRKIVPALVISAMLLGGCATKTTVLLDQRMPHRLARAASVQVWARLPDGSLAAQWVTVQEGWWIASPQVVDP